MSIDAAKKFVAESKKTVKGFKAEASDFYKRYIKPTSVVPQKDNWDKDIKELTSLIAEMEKVEDAYGEAAAAAGDFGGSSDNTIKSTRTLLETIKKEIAKAKKESQ